MPRIEIAFLPDAQIAGVVTSRAIDLRVLTVFGGAFAHFGIVTIGALRGRTVRAVTLGTLHRFVNHRFVLLFDHLKTVTTLVALGTQLGRLLDRFVRLRSVIPKRKRGGIRTADRLMAHVATDTLPTVSRNRHAAFQIRTRRARDAFARATIEGLLGGGRSRVPVS